MTSSWISSILYKRLPDGSSYLAIFCKDTDSHDHQWPWDKPKEEVALLYGPSIPKWLPGLLHAGTGKRSPGLAYNKLLKGKYPYQRVEGKEKVSELWRIFAK